MANGNSYSINWSNVSANSYSVTARATDSKNEAASTAPITVNVINNSAPVVSLTASPSNAVAPATIILNATATDSDGTITQVEFLNGSSSIATVTQAPYTTNWANVAQGNYSITARATDNLGTSTTSTPVPVTVAASAPKIYDIHTDQIDTPRLITDQNGNTVWRWDSAPFGETLPNEQPTQATARFVFDLRFPGQQYDAETGLHYNYFRDYDPQAGRYVESDPIGLGGGINTYGYVNARPVEYVDPLGLCKTCGDGNGGLNGGTPGGAMSFMNFLKENTSLVPSSGNTNPGVSRDNSRRNVVPFELTPQQIDAIANGCISTGSGPQICFAPTGIEAAAAGILIAPEKFVVQIAKRIGKDLGPKARRAFHDEFHLVDRTKEEVIRDARQVYEDLCKEIPDWLRKYGRGGGHD